MPVKRPLMNDIRRRTLMSMLSWLNRNWATDRELYEKWVYMQGRTKTSKLRHVRLNSNYRRSPPNSEKYLSEFIIIVSQLYILGISGVPQSITLDNFSDIYDCNSGRWWYLLGSNLQDKCNKLAVKIDL